MINSSPEKRKSLYQGIGLTILSFFLLFSSATLQMRYDAIVAEHFDLRAPIHRSVMPASVIRHFTFGFQSVVADYYWITAVQDYLKWDGRDYYYPEYFQIIATLDAKFAYPYFFGILTVPNKRNSESLEWLAQIAERGARALPNEWNIPFSAATQFHVIGKNNERAIQFLEIAAKVSTAPEIVHRSLAIYLMRDASDYSRSRALFQTILDTTDNEETAKIIAERIQLLDLVEGLEQGILRYRASFGVYPASVDGLTSRSQSPLSESTKNLIAKYAPRIDQVTGKIILR